MGPLSRKDCRALSSALGLIYGTKSLADFPAGVLSAVRRLLPCNTICFNEMTGGSMTSWITEPADAFPGPALRQAFTQNVGQHPVLAHYLTTGDGGSYRISDFVSRHQFHLLPLYREYYRPSSVEYQLITAISARGRQIGVALDRDVADFSDDERLSLELLRPHLMQAYHNAQSMDLLTRAVETGEKRLVSVDRSRPCASAVDDVWRLFEKYFGFSLCRGYLPDAPLRWVEHERLRLADDSDVPSPPVPLIVNKGNERLTLQFIWGGQNGDRDAVLLEETRTPSVSPVAAWDLTPRESEVLALLAQGRTNAEIGLALSISSLTVKKHLEHIYEKMDVHGRAGAVGRRHR